MSFMGYPIKVPITEPSQPLIAQRSLGNGLIPLYHRVHFSNSNMKDDGEEGSNQRY